MTIAKDANTFFGAESVQDPYPLYERMRAAGSVHRIANSDFYAVCGWDAVNEAIGRPEDFSSNLTAMNRPGMSGDSSSWKGWGHVRWFIEEVPAGAA